MSAPRQSFTIEEIKDRLLDRIDAVVDRYAPPAPGSYRKGHLWFTLNPGRADRSVGSFCVHLSGPKAGRWYDYATHPKGGDLLDLIGLSLNLSPVDAIREARAFLGLETETPELRRKRDEAAAKAKARRAAELAAHAEKVAKDQKLAHAIWLSGTAQLTGTPVDFYLRGRGIDLSRLGHLPGAIRFHAACRYYWTEDCVDPETGEVAVDPKTGKARTRSVYRTMPAMLSAIVQGRKFIDCHRTYLEQGPDGLWRKASVPDAKKVFTNYTGGAIRLCGALGPRGGRLRLNEAPQGACVWITEGIENGLSLMALRALTGRDPAFVVAAGMGWNLGQVELPDSVAEVVLCADRDTGAQAQDALDAAVAAHAAKGRAVRIFGSPVPGEDLNDWLRRALAEEEAAQPPGDVE